MWAIPEGICCAHPGQRYILVAAAPGIRRVTHSPSGPVSRRWPPVMRSMSSSSSGTPEEYFLLPREDLRRGDLRRGLTISRIGEVETKRAGGHRRVRHTARPPLPRSGLAGASALTVAFTGVDLGQPVPQHRCGHRDAGETVVTHGDQGADDGFGATILQELGRPLRVTATEPHRRVDVLGIDVAVTDHAQRVVDLWGDEHLPQVEVLLLADHLRQTSVGGRFGLPVLTGVEALAGLAAVVTGRDHAAQQRGGHVPC